MKYIEELKNGDSFLYEDLPFVITSDFKNNGSKLSYSLKDGFPKWFEGNIIVEDIQIYRMDKSNNIIPIKETPKDDTILS